MSAVEHFSAQVFSASAAAAATATRAATAGAVVEVLLSVVVSAVAVTLDASPCKKGVRMGCGVYYGLYAAAAAGRCC
jgi:hypothetical protein